MNYIDDLLKLHYKQTDKGMSKYGQPLEQHDADILDRLNHIQEELMDALHYTFWLGEKLRAREQAASVQEPEKSHQKCSTCKHEPLAAYMEPCHSCNKLPGNNYNIYPNNWEEKEFWSRQ